MDKTLTEIIVALDAFSVAQQAVLVAAARARLHDQDPRVFERAAAKIATALEAAANLQAIVCVLVDAEAPLEPEVRESVRAIHRHALDIERSLDGPTVSPRTHERTGG